MFVEVSLWPEFFCIFAEYRAVMITVPHVWYAYSAFWNEHAFVPVIFSRGVSDTKWCARTPAKNFFDNCPHEWKTRSVVKGRKTVAANHGIQFGLCSALHFWEGNHSKCPPTKGSSACFRTRGTEIVTFSLIRHRTDKNNDSHLL